MKRQDFRCLEPLQVRWAEIDMQGIVFNGHYLMYVDTALAGYWRALAMPYHEAMAALGGDLYVRKATLEYLASARDGDALEVGVRCERVGNTSMAFAAAFFRGDTVLVTGEIVYVFADAAQAPRPVPQALRDAMAAFQAGEPMVSVEVGRWEELGDRAGPLRHRVFVGEQGIEAAIEQDGRDSGAVHALATNRFGQAVGTGRLLEIAPGVGRIGRMAVMRDVRRCGVGAAVLEALVRAARERGLQQVALHAQVHAEAFYRRAGFEPRGEPFTEAGVEHREMVRPAQA
jgi:YbgC/YbaW family acyl-CoA thioester hydrolase